MNESEMYMLTYNRNLLSIIISAMPEFIRLDYYGNKVSKIVKKAFQNIKGVDHVRAWYSKGSITASINLTPDKYGKYRGISINYKISYNELVKIVDEQSEINKNDIIKHMCLCHRAKDRYLKMKRRGVEHKFESFFFIPASSWKMF